jgi:hypothetical protein
VDECPHTGDTPFRGGPVREHASQPKDRSLPVLTAILIILAVVLVLVIGMSLMGAGPSRFRRRTVVERPARRRVVEEPVVRERVVERPAAREEVVEEPPTTRRTVE